MWSLALVGCASGAGLTAVMPLGAVQPTDMPMLFLALAAVTASAWVYRNRLHDPAFLASRPWRLLLPVALLAAGAAAAIPASGQRWTLLLGAPGSSLGLAQWLALAGAAFGAAYMGGRVRDAVVQIAPWMLLVQCGAVVVQLVAGRPGIGTLSNSSFMAQVVVALLPFALVPALARDPRLSRFGVNARLAVSAGTILALAVTGSRAGAVLALGGAGACWAFARGWMPRLPERSLVRAAVAAGAMAVAALPVAVVLALPEGTVPRSIVGVRPEMWEAAVRVWRASPLLGVGPDGYRVASAPLASAALSANEAALNQGFGALAADPHNIVALLLSAGGLVGLVAATWLLFEVLRNWAVQRAAGRLDGAAALGTVLFALTTLMTPVPLQTALFGAVVLGVSLAPERVPGRKDEPAETLRAAAWAPWVLFGLAALLVFAHVMTRVAVGPIEEGKVTPARAARTQAASELWRSDPFLHFWAGRMWMFLGAGSPDALRLAIADSATAARMEPANPFYARDRALALKLFSQDVTATADAYRSALVLFPNWFEATFEFADYLLENGRPEEAEAYALKAIELGPNVGEAHGLAAAVYDALGEPGKAEEQRRLATELLAQHGTLEQTR